MDFDIVAHLHSVLNVAEITSLLPNRKLFFLHAENALTPYVEFEMLGERGFKHAENKETATEYLVQVDIFSKSDYANIEKLIRNKLITAGYVRQDAADLYEGDTKLYHKAMRFSYIHFC